MATVGLVRGGSSGRLIRRHGFQDEIRNPAWMTFIPIGPVDGFPAKLRRAGAGDDLLRLHVPNPGAKFDTDAAVAARADRMR